MFVTSLAIIPCVYCFSFLFKNPANASNYIGFLNFALGLILFIVNMIIFGLDISQKTKDLYDNLFSFAPQFCFAQMIFITFYNGNIRKSCEKNEITKATCEQMEFNYVDNIFTTEDGGIGEYLWASVGLIFFYFAILTLIEWESGTGVIKAFFGCKGGSNKPKDPEAEIQFEDEVLD